MTAKYTPKAVLAPDDFQLIAQIKSLKKVGYTNLDICRQLEIERESEIKLVAEICSARDLRRYQRGTDSVHPGNTSLLRAGTWA